MNKISSLIVFAAVLSVLNISVDAACGSYNANIYTCCNGALSLGPNQSCCGTQAYNSNINTCCSGKLSLGPYQSCCGTQAYNYNIYTCCSGKLSLGPNQSCCGTQAYNYNLYKCCNNVLKFGFHCWKIQTIYWIIDLTYLERKLVNYRFIIILNNM